jgi:diguanylate cyclase (GGDEF)-like protein
MPDRDDSPGTEHLLTARRLSLATLVLVALMCMLCIGVLVSAYRDTERNAERNTRNLSVLLARDVDRDISMSEFALRDAAARMREQHGAVPLPDDAPGNLIDGEGLHALGQIWFADADGAVSAPGAPAFVAQSDFFRYHQQHADRNPLITPPAKDDAGAYGIVLSQRYDRPDGSFGGVLFTTIDLRYFYRLLEDVNVGGDGHVVLYRRDGTVLMEYPPNTANLGRNMSGQTLFGTLASGVDGVEIGPSAFDEVERLRAFHAVEDQPLVLSVGIAMHDVFLGWRDKALLIVLYTMVLGSATVGLAFFLVRELKRRQTLESQLLRIARTDSLTQLGNRRLFDESLKREWDRAARLRKPLALLMLDIDWFKKFNDMYGHPTGDVALREVANCIARAVHRPADTCSRYGGEEFTVILPETNLAGAYHVAERIRRAVEQRAMPHEDSPLKIVTVSIGVAMVVPAPGLDSKSLVDGADEAMYRAKQAGRNRALAQRATEAAEAMRSIGA